MCALVLFCASPAVQHGGSEKTVLKQQSLKSWEISPVLGHHEDDNPWPVLPVHLIDSIRQQCDSGEVLQKGRNIFSHPHKSWEVFRYMDRDILSNK